MLEQVHSITHGTDPKNYIRGFILSMVESAEDIKNGINLVKKFLKAMPCQLCPCLKINLPSLTQIQY